MKVAHKHTLALLFGILAVMAGYAYWQTRHEVVLLEAEAGKARLLGADIVLSLEQIWQFEGEARVQEVIERANRTVPEIGLRVVSLDAPVGDPRRPAISDDQLSALAAGRIVQVVRENQAGENWSYTYEALVIAGMRPAALELAESINPELTYMQMSHWAIFGATLTVVVVCGLIATGLDAWFIGWPLQLLRDKLRRAGAGDFSQPLVLRQRDEIGELAREVNAMCERIADANRHLATEMEGRIAALEQLRHTDRLATVGQLAAGVAHELGTPLNVVSARAHQLTVTDMSRPEVVNNAHIIVEQSDRMTEIIQQLLEFSRRRRGQPGVIGLERIVTRTLELLSSVAEPSGVVFDCKVAAAEIPVYVDQNQIQQVLTNIILNGIQAMPDGGRLHVRVSPQRVRPPREPGGPEGDYPCVTVEDEGQGIPTEQLGRIFEPFFTTKAVGEGTGLGLAIAYGIIAEHGGWIAVESTVGKGSRFSIFLPPATGAHTREIDAAS